MPQDDGLVTGTWSLADPPDADIAAVRAGDPFVAANAYRLRAIAWALLALQVFNAQLSVIAFIGIILLIGIVTKNSILLVEYANQLREKGMDIVSAMLESGRIRLRPILMTTLAMIFGMLPVALAMGEGGAFRAPMARAVIGGLITSTLLTLVVVPVAYTYFDDMGTWVKRKLVSKEKQAEIDEQARKLAERQTARV